MERIEELLKNSPKRIMLCGHTKPDGDCVGAVMGLYHYLKQVTDACIVPYLEDPIESLQFLVEGFPFRTDAGETEAYDLAISLDASSGTRIGAGKEAFFRAKENAVIDHHGTNPGFGGRNHIIADASSTCEVLTELMTDERIGKEAAQALFTGIICDTGVFRYDCTTEETLITAARLIKKGIPFSWIIEHTNTERRYEELRISSAIIESSVYLPEERFAYAVADKALQERYGVYAKDLGAVVSDLNTIADTDAVLFIYWNDTRWKGSLRAKGKVDVSRIAAQFGGGGHVKAAGFDCELSPEEIVKEVRRLLKEQTGERL